MVTSMSSSSIGCCQRSTASPAHQAARRQGLDPGLILSALSAVNERVDGLRAGGDDYLAKPFEFIELTARVDALARRKMAAEAVNELVVGDLRLDLIERRAPLRRP